MKKKVLIFLSVLISYIGTVTLIYYFESLAENPNILTVFDAFWYSIVTLTTVGYGVYHPVSPEGRIIASLLIISSLGILGYFIGKLTEHIQYLAERHKMGLDGTKLANHVVIIGWNDFSHGVLTQLVNADIKACLITNNKDNIDLIYNNFTKDQVFVIYSDYNAPDCLDKANAQRATSLMPCLDDDTKNLVFILNTKKKFPDISIVVRINQPELKETFSSAGVSFTITQNEVSSKIVASYMFEPSVASFSDDLLASATDDEDYDIKQYYISDNYPYADKKFSETFHNLKNRYNVVAVGIEKFENGKTKLIKLPSDETILSSGDYLLVMTSGKNTKHLDKVFGCKEGLHFTP
ncbi:MAG: potassium channel protein [Desulfotalea sp.]